MTHKTDDNNNENDVHASLHIRANQGENGEETPTPLTTNMTAQPCDDSEKDSKGTPKGQLALYLAVLWMTGFLLNMIKVYHSVFSTGIQCRTGASNGAISTLFLIPQLTAVVSNLTTPSLFATYGIMKCVVVSSIACVLAFVLVGVGVTVKSFLPVVVGLTVGLPQVYVLTFSLRMTLYSSLPKDSYTHWSATGIAVRSLGFTTAYLCLPQLNVVTGTWTITAATVCVLLLSHMSVRKGYVLCTLRTDNDGPVTECIADLGKDSNESGDTHGDVDEELSTTSIDSGQEDDAEEAVEVCETAVVVLDPPKFKNAPSTLARLAKDLKNKLSLEALRLFPKQYWNIALLGAAAKVIYGFAVVFPTIYQRVHGLSSAGANRMASLDSITIIVLGPFAGWLFANANKEMRMCTLPSHGSLFIGAAFLFLVSHLVPAMFWATWIGYFLIIMQGSAGAFFSAGTTGILPQSLKKKPHLVASGYAWTSIFGQIANALTSQLCLYTFHHSHETHSIFTITSGEFSMVGMAALTILLAIGYKRSESLLGKPSKGEDQAEGEEPAVAKQVPSERVTPPVVRLHKKCPSDASSSARSTPWRTTGEVVHVEGGRRTIHTQQDSNVRTGPT